MNATRIIVFAKAPLPGAAKTRLIPALGPDGAARLARQMLDFTIGVATDARLGPVELCMSPAPGAAEWQGLSFDAGIELSDQGDGHLGARMAGAARRSIACGELVILLGTDCPDLSVPLLRQADAALRETGAVIHCTADGGYALLGLSRYDEELFREIPWSSAHVATETLRRFAQLDWPLHFGRTLHDVDEPEDLIWLPSGWIPAGSSQTNEKADAR